MTRRKRLSFITLALARPYQLHFLNTHVLAPAHMYARGCTGKAPQNLQARAMCVALRRSLRLANLIHRNAGEQALAETERNSSLYKSIKLLCTVAVESYF